MAATIRTILNGRNKYESVLTRVWATANDTDTVVVDRSTLTGPDGVNPPTYIRVDAIEWDIAGYSYILLEFDDGTDEQIAVLSGSGYMKFDGNRIKMSAAPATATEGDILLTEVGGQSGDGYTIHLWCTLKE